MVASSSKKIGSAQQLSGDFEASVSSRGGPPVLLVYESTAWKVTRTLGALVSGTVIDHDHFEDLVGDLLLE